MYTLPAPVILRAQNERVVLNPEDVMFEGTLMQKLGTPIPDELVEECAKNKVRIYAEAGQWCAEPLI